jgi:hypothetical protein
MDHTSKNPQLRAKEVLLFRSLCILVYSVKKVGCSIDASNHHVIWCINDACRVACKDVN